MSFYINKIINFYYILPIIYFSLQYLEKYINESEHGLIYFSMGSLLRSATFRKEKLDAFLYAFSKIPQRVLWKWDQDVLPGKSDNIKLIKWAPQRDILGNGANLNVYL